MDSKIPVNRVEKNLKISKKPLKRNNGVLKNRRTNDGCRIRNVVTDIVNTLYNRRCRCGVPIDGSQTTEAGQDLFSFLHTQIFLPKMIDLI